MFRRMSLTVVLVGSVCLLAACTGNPEPEKGKPGANQAAVTLHVPDMIGRQGIT